MTECPDGVITRDQFKSIYAAVFPDGDSSLVSFSAYVLLCVSNNSMPVTWVCVCLCTFYHHYIFPQPISHHFDWLENTFLGICEALHGPAILHEIFKEFVSVTRILFKMSSCIFMSFPLNAHAMHTILPGDRLYIEVF